MKLLDLTQDQMYQKKTTYQLKEKKEQSIVMVPKSQWIQNL
jgi:hypothetical protein